MNTEKYVEKLSVHLKCANYSPRTVQTYCSLLRKFLNAGWSAETPKQINTDQLKGYIISQRSTSTMRQVHGMLNHFYNCIGQPRKMQWIPYPKKENRLPQIMPQDVVNARIKKIPNLKHRCICMLLYGCGLRISELLNLTITDIDSKRMMVRVRSGKGMKDRFVPLPEHLLNELRWYWRAYRPTGWLFEGQTKKQYSKMSVQQITKKHVGCKPHTLRHCFATHSHESGTSLAVIQQLLGHSNIKTTMVYLHVSQRQLMSAVSPLAA